MSGGDVDKSDDDAWWPEWGAPDRQIEIALGEGEGEEEPHWHWQDPEAVPLPPSLRQPCRWTTPASLSSDILFVPVQEDVDLRDLCGDEALTKSQFLRGYAAAVEVTRGVQDQWRPWQHVEPNASGVPGRHCVRLHWMGAWRRVAVDNRAPLDLTPERRSLLPDGGAALWPLVVCKALCKLASLTWQNDGAELVDFDIVSCLTGWPPAVVVYSLGAEPTMGDETEDDMWQTCVSHARTHYAWRHGEDDMKAQDHLAKVGAAGLAPSMSATTTKTAKSGKSAKSGGSKKKGTPATPATTAKAGKKQPKPQPEPVYHCSTVVVTWRDADTETHQDLVLVQTRDIPSMFDPPDPNAELDPWKRHRWESWAIDRGILPPKDTDGFKAEAREGEERVTRRLVLLRGRRRERPNPWSVQSLQPAPPPRHGFRTLRRNVLVVDAIVAGTQILPLNLYREQDEDAVDAMTEEVWRTFSSLMGQLVTLRVYHHPEAYRAVCRVVETPSGSGAGEPSSSWCLKDPRPLYLFAEGHVPYVLVVTLGAACCPAFPTGDLRNPTASDDGDGGRAPSQTGCTKEPCLAGACPEECRCQEPGSSGSGGTPPEDSRTRSGLIAERYGWKEDAFFADGVCLAVSTYGTRTVTARLPAGRTLLRLWGWGALRLHWVLAMADVPATAGALDATHDTTALLDVLSIEADRPTRAYLRLCGAFAVLVAGLATPGHDVRLRGLLPAADRDLLSDALLDTATANCPAVAPVLCRRTLRALLMEMTLGASAFRALVRHQCDDYDDAAVADDDADTQDPDGCRCVDVNAELARVERRRAAASKVQAFFRRIYVQRLVRSCLRSDDARFPNLFTVAKTIYANVFSAQQRQLGNVGADLMRRMAPPDLLGDLVDLTVDVQHLDGTLTLPRATSADKDEWIMVAMADLECSQSGLPVRLFAQCDRLPRLVLRVFRLDGQEVKRWPAAAGQFRTSATGLKVLLYGWRRVEGEAEGERPSVVSATSSFTKATWRMSMCSQRIAGEASAARLVYRGPHPTTSGALWLTTDCRGRCVAQVNLTVTSAQPHPCVTFRAEAEPFPDETTTPTAKCRLWMRCVQRNATTTAVPPTETDAVTPGPLIFPVVQLQSCEPAERKTSRTSSSHLRASSSSISGRRRSSRHSSARTTSVDAEYALEVQVLLTNDTATTALAGRRARPHRHHVYVWAGHDGGGRLALEMDATRARQIEDVKMRCWAEAEDRLERGNAIRRRFVQDHRSSVDSAASGAASVNVSAETSEGIAGDETSDRVEEQIDECVESRNDEEEDDEETGPCELCGKRQLPIEQDNSGVPIVTVVSLYCTNARHRDTDCWPRVVCTTPVLPDVEEEVEIEIEEGEEEAEGDESVDAESRFSPAPAPSVCEPKDAAALQRWYFETVRAQSAVMMLELERLKKARGAARKVA